MEIRRLISVIIVNYNVKFFLEQCLYAVREALLREPGEIIVFDNASSDGSREYLEPRFPEVRFIWSSENLGFAKANNLAVKEAKGDIVLFLNPDTIIGEDCLENTAGFLRERPDAGALGVRMVDGSGRFLKESKRAYPGVMTSFYKLSGLSSLFPRSKRFSRYHLGHLDPFQTHEVDVLAGAFMMVKKEVLDKTGGFDEQFFMYGEDIDLSYRIQRAGYKNFYHADTTIIHFKGESTKRGSLNYVRIFYRAMIIFVDKHYSGIHAVLFRFFLNVSIWIRAFLAMMAGFAFRNGIGILDGVLIFGAYAFSSLLWQQLVRPEVRYNPYLLTIAFGVATAIHLVIVRFAGLHDRRQQQHREWKSILLGSLILFFIYALLPESVRFSRGMLILGSFFSYLALAVSRHWWRKRGIIEEAEKNSIAIVGTPDDRDSIREWLLPTADEFSEERIICIPPGKIRKVQKAKELPAFMFGIQQSDLILCKSELSYNEIIQLTEELPKDLRIRYHAPGSASIIGSDSSETSGMAYSGESHFSLGQAENRRMKRLADRSICLLLLFILPILLFFIKNPATFCRNYLNVWMGKKTWVGYIRPDPALPKLVPGVLGADGLPVESGLLREERLTEMDRLYAREYRFGRDLRLVIKGIRYLSYS